MLYRKTLYDFGANLRGGNISKVLSPSVHSITVVCPRLLTVGDSVVLFFFCFLSFLILYGAPAMSLT